MPSIPKVERELRREQNSTYNCLLSILDDSRFVNEIISLYPGLPVFANLRCGLWYLKDAKKTCYFKSTDGHSGQWSFSLTRLNLNVAAAVSEAGGCIIVDATRRGKTFPACSALACLCPGSIALTSISSYPAMYFSQETDCADHSAAAQCACSRFPLRITILPLN
jgi:hypothetical protein